MNNHAIKSGVILGIIGIVITLLLYLIDPTLLASGWIGFGSLIIFVGIVAYFGIQHRNESGGFMTFGQGWVYSIQVFLIAGLVSTIFRILLFNVIDPELSEIVVDQMVENQASTLSGFGVPEDQIDEQLDKIRESGMEGNTPIGMLKGFLFLAIVYAVLSLITGAIIKKKEPELE